MLNLSMMKKTATDSKAKEKTWTYMQPAWLIVNCQGKDVGVLFRLNYTIH